MPETPKSSLLSIVPNHPLVTAPERLAPIFLHELPQHDEEFRHLLAHILLPADLLVNLNIDPITLRNKAGEIMVLSATADDGMTWALRLMSDVDPRDAVMEIEMGDTPFNRIAIHWLAINNPTAPRFDVDRMPDGATTLRGTAKRNLTAEIAAMHAGLAPGQVRQGLRRMGKLLADMEQFFAAIHHYEFDVEPLFYHTAILFERYGFQYSRGEAFLQRIHRDFLPNGALRKKLDGKSPFRRPEMADSIRGRSWAIHDGILDEPWDGIKMYKRLGIHGGIDTATGVVW
ncbi:MAG: hypothetical protein DSY55_03240 [Clostridia bacterium]|nr:MAG: hypothetical protein DSY55_03240 [Clostridia bacterium]